MLSTLAGVTKTFSVNTVLWRIENVQLPRSRPVQPALHHPFELQFDVCNDDLWVRDLSQSTRPVRSKEKFSRPLDKMETN